MTQEKLPIYGGQAVIEGVMMRGQRGMAVAVRTPEGDIKIHTEPLNRLYSGRIARIPFMRGLLGLWDALGLGMRTLTWSADVAAGDEVEFSGPLAIGTVIISMAFGIGLFFLTPAGLSRWLESLLNIDSTLLTNLIEGLVRLVLIIGYISLIGLIEDVKRLYGYHGAEHKTINAFEAGDDLTPEQVARHTLYHPRCGTAFILIVVLFSIILFSALGDLPKWAVFLTRIAFIPVLAALAYEYLRFTASHIDNPIIRVIALPGLWMQRLTTREPDHAMLQVAIEAFQEMQRAEHMAPGETIPTTDRVILAAESASD